MDSNIVASFLSDPVNGGLVLRASLKNFIAFFHWYLYRTDFVFKDFHEIIIRKIEDIAFGRAKKRNLLINVPPRMGKSAIVKYACAWSYMLNPGSNCMYTSYSDSIASDFSKEIREIVESDAFRKFTGIDFKKDKKGADYWATSAGGGFRAAPLGGGLTGYGFGVSGDEFGGFGICFPYDELVWTDKGKEPIGEIVEKKLKRKVLSYNLKKDSFEYQPIEGYVKNEESDILKIVFEEGMVECTPEHYFLTTRGYVKACDLMPYDRVMIAPDAFDLPKRKIKVICYVLPRIIFIKDKFKLLLCKSSYFNRFYNLVSKALKGFSIFNLRNGRSTDTIRASNLDIRPRVSTNINNISSGEIGAGKDKSSMFGCIAHIFGFGAISNIFHYIVGGVFVQMSNFHAVCLIPYKGMGNCLMNVHPLCLRMFRAYNKIIAVFIKMKLKHLLGNVIRRLISSRLNQSPQRFDSTTRTNFITSFEPDYRKPLFIYKTRHVNHSYCLTIRHNHNMVIGKNQGFVAKNCDDPNKPSLVKSQTELQNTIDLYENAYRSRANNRAKSPTIMIMQRVAVDDLAGYVMENEAEDWEIVKIPALNEETGIALWEDKFPARELLKLKKQNPFVYYSQYQQEPIVIGGSVYKTEWFRYYNMAEDYQYQFSFFTADTAQKKGEGNDYTVFQYWGKTIDNRLHLIDMVRGKFDAEELRQQILLFWDKWKAGVGRGDFKCPPYGFYIEDKSSGIGVLQEIKKNHPIPVIPISRNRYKDDKGMWKSQDKFSRAMTAIPYIANGWVYLPNSEKDDISSIILAEAAAFKADLSHKHEDALDCLNDAIDIAFGATGISSVFI